MNIPAYLDRLDTGQRQAVEADRNVVVTAGAGAGKTTVLAARYAHLVIGQSIPVREILALTFTRKAAAEMYERIYKKLADSDSPWAREQLKNFGQARISTLDSFCAEIVRQGAGDFGYSPDFIIDDNKCADLAASIAQRFVLRNTGNPGIGKMLESYQFGDLVDSFFGQIGKSHVSPLALKSPAFSLMEASLAALYARELKDRKNTLSGICTELISFNSNPGDRRADSLAAITAAQGFLESQGLTAASLEPELKAIAALQMKSYGRSPGEIAIKELAKRAREDAVTLLDFAEYERLAPLHGQMLASLDGFALEVAEAKRMADVMDFKDLGICAVQLLTRRKDLRQKWKSSIRRIMIDEFQDDNSLQRDLLYLLAEKMEMFSAGIPKASDLEEGKLFFVGDEKQSIYRFRGADVSVFKTLARDLRPLNQEGGTSDITLSTNYRSSAALIDFFNRIFPEVMAKDSGESHEFEAEYTPMSPGPLAEARNEFPSRIELTIINRDTTEDTRRDEKELLDYDDAVAYEVARTIAGLRGKLALRDRVADYDDFAILLRTTSHQHRLEKFLRRLDIPFESENPKGLFRESPASDMYHILALEENPRDKNAFAAVMRSPLCRIGDEAFTRLLALADDFWANALELPLSAQDREGIERGSRFMDRLKLLAGSKPLSDLVSIIWHQGGLAAELESRPESQPFLEHYDFLFHLAAGIEAAGGGIIDLLDLLRPLLRLEEDAIELNHVPRHSTKGVRIMTIHKAKGLQFPVVIIPWVEGQGSSQRSQALWQMLPEGLAIDLKPYDKPGAMSKNIFFDIAREVEASKARAEIKRLFYVACTRAEDHLFFFGKTPARQDNTGSSFLSFLDSGKLEIRSLPPAFQEEASRFTAEEPTPLPYRSSPGMAEDAPSRPGRITATAVNEYAHLSGLFELPESLIDIIPHPEPPRFLKDEIRLAPAVFGTLCHEAVEYAITTGSTEGFIPTDATADIAQAVSYAQAFLLSPFWRGKPETSKFQNEKPFLYSIGNLVIDGRMDLFIESLDEVFIIDFKSDAILDPKRYAIQLQIYRNAAAGFRPGKTISTGLYDLRNGNLLWTRPMITEAMLADIATAAMKEIR